MFFCLYAVSMLIFSETNKWGYFVVRKSEKEANKHNCGAAQSGEPEAAELDQCQRHIQARFATDLNYHC